MKIAGVIISLMIVEIVSRYLISSDWIIRTTPEISSARWRLEWRKRVPMSDVTGYSIDSYHPLLGWSPAASSDNIQVGNSFVTINAEGIRGSTMYSRMKQPGKTRIVVIGDSFTFGEGVNDDETYPSQLGALLPDSEVLNFGVHGYGIDQMTLRLETEGLLFNPDYVVYAIIGDDINRAFLDFRDYAKPQFTLRGNELFLSNTPVIPPKRYAQLLRFTPAAYELIVLLRDRIVLRNVDTARFTALADAIWKKTATDVRNKGAVPVFLFLPVLDEMVDQREGYLEKERMMFSFCKTEKIPCFSARTYLLDAQKHGATYNIHSHYEPKTNRIIAEGLAADLTRLFSDRKQNYAQ